MLCIIRNKDGKLEVHKELSAIRMAQAVIENQVVLYIESDFDLILSEFAGVDRWSFENAGKGLATVIHYMTTYLCGMLDEKNTSGLVERALFYMFFLRFHVFENLLKELETWKPEQMLFHDFNKQTPVRTAPEPAKEQGSHLGG